MKYLWSLLILVFITACGYKPASYYASEALGERIHVDVTISRKDPKNSVLIKDAVNESIITRLGGKLSSKDTSTSELFVKIGSISFSPILYNKNGYVTSYKAKVFLNIKYVTKNGKSERFSTIGEYDFSIDENEDGTRNSVISDSNRFEAIKLASLDALNEFVSRIAIKGMK